MTLQNELSDLKSELSEYDLVLKTKNNIAFVIGNERNKKRLISSMIYHETKSFNCTLSSIQPYFPAYDLKILKKLITTDMVTNNLFMDDFLLFNFIIHVAISMQRSSYENQLNVENSEMTFPEDIQNTIHSLVEEVRKYFSVTLSAGDQQELSALLMSQTYPREIITSCAQNFEDMITDEVNTLFELIQNKVRHLFSINLNSEKFSLRFKLHLRNLLIRIRNNISLRNPQIATIKSSYPFIYEIAVSIANVINQQYQVELNEDEIAYIVLHIGVLIEEQKLIPIRFLFFWFIRRMVCISLIWLIKSSYYWNRMLLSQELFLLLMNSAFIGIMMRLFLLFHFIRFRLYQSFIFRSSSRQKIFLTSLIISTG